jgi:hypothetical protein
MANSIHRRDLLRAIANALSHRTLWRCALALSVCVSVLTGCGSADKTLGPRTASVDIRLNTPRQISEVVQAVFHDQGYVLVHTERLKLVFEKEASAAASLAYGSWMDKTVWVRVKVSMTLAGEETVHVQAIAFHVQERGTSIEKEIPERGLQPKPFQKLLDEVARRLRG